jgi:hypothetical protein
VFAAAFREANIVRGKLARTRIIDLVVDERGTAASMMKLDSKPRRTKTQKAADDAYEAEMKAEYPILKAKVANLKEQVDQVGELRQHVAQQNLLIKALVDRGIVATDASGNIVLPPPQQQEPEKK